MSQKIGPKHLKSLANANLAEEVKRYEGIIDRALKATGGLNGTELKIVVDKLPVPDVMSHLRKLYCEGDDPWGGISTDTFNDRNESIHYIVLHQYTQYNNSNWMDR